MDPWEFMDRAMGCLSGGACGDALGYPVEFMSRREVACRYGPDGVTGFAIGEGPVRISDDTQMTLLTAWGIIRGRTDSGEGIVPCVYAYYRMWAEAQGFAMEEYPRDAGMDPMFLFNPWMRERRAPGTTCISQLTRHSCYGTRGSPANDSKGCGGIMRTAPVPIAMAFRPVGDAMETAADIAATTHGHPLGWLSAAVCSAIIWHEMQGDGVRAAVASALEDGRALYGDVPHWGELEDLVGRAVGLSGTGISDAEGLKSLGEGWVAEETLAMAVFACLRHEHDLRSALVAAVNIDGDSDSVGAVAGNILGASIGRAGVMEAFDPLLLECDDLMSVTLFLLAPGEVVDAIRRGRRVGEGL